MAEITTLGAPIKTAYEGQPNTNAFTDAEKAKLAAVPTSFDANTVGLGNVDNTSDLNKPISTVTQTALDQKASITQTLEGAGGLIGGNLANQDYRIFIKMPHGGTITETVTRSTAGTATATFKINTTALGGTSNSVSTTEQSQAHSSSNTFAAGDDIVITISSNSSAANMSFMIKYTRDLQ